MKKLKLTLALIIAISLIITIFTACSKTSEKSTMFLWEVTQKNKDTKLYLFGSVHVADEKLYPLNTKIEDCFNCSKYLVVECDTGKLKPEDQQALLAKYGTYTGEDTLQKNISADTYEKLGKEYKEFGIDIKQLDKFKPWVIATQLEQLRLSKLGYKAENGLDLHFLNRARNYKEILELETVDSQLSMLSGLEKEIQDLNVKDTLDSKEDTKEYIEKMFDVWGKGNIKALEDMVFEDLKKDKTLQPLYDKIYFERNEKMAEKIDGYLKDGKACFVVVGSGHLVGDKSIVNLLKEKGYEVKQY